MSVAMSVRRSHLPRRPAKSLVTASNLATLTILAAIGSALMALPFMTNEQRYVFAPGAACAIIFLWLFATLWARDRVVPMFDVGFFCGLATFAYSVYPLLNYWANGLEFSFADHSDNRLAWYGPSPSEIGLFHLRHVLYLFCFVLSYLWLRGRGSVVEARVERPPLETQAVIAISFIVLTAYFMFLKSLMGISYHTSYVADEFAKNLEAVSSAPRWVLQFSGKLAGLLFVMKLGLLYIVVSHSRRRLWLMVLGIWVMFEVTNAFILKGARGGMVLFLLATVLLYHRLVRPLSFKQLSLIGASVFTLFMFLGLWRSYSNLEVMRYEIRRTEGGLFSGSNEFQALLGTAYDVAQRKAAGLEMPWYLYINDIVDILPPQQLLPFQKVSASEWYLRELGVFGTGQGYMWGVITQAIVGLDWFELALRGFILGALLAWVQRWYRRHQSGFLETLAYVYLCIHVYYTFRNTTLSILANIVWELLPLMAIVAATTALLSRVVRKRTDTLVSAPRP
jgi:hypothetical protein